MRFNSDRNILEGDEGAQHRSLYKSMGYTDDDLKRPMVAVVDTWSTACPGHYTLRSVSEAVRNGIYRAGGTPVEFGTIAACDGIAVGNEGMEYILPSRDIIAQSVEVMVSAHQLDAVVLIGSCDKIVPGLVMAAIRLNLPTIFVNGGPMLPGRFEDKPIDVNQVMINLGAFYDGKISKEKFKELENSACPTPGSCQMMGTANTLCTFVEAVGLSLPQSAAIPAVYAKRLHVAQESGKQIIELYKKNIRARDIINKSSMINGIKVAMAVGGSTNLILHTMAMMNILGIDFDIRDFNSISDETPYICSLLPASDFTMLDFWYAGGVAAVMKELTGVIDFDCLTVTGKTVKDNLLKVENKNKEVIRTIDKAYQKTGGIAILEGNLAPGAGVSRPAVIKSESLHFRGPAKVFNSEKELFNGIYENNIKIGDVLVVRYEGPKGGPGMREMYVPLELIKGKGLENKVALVTDGRFSGSNSGCFVGHICPEAADGGPIAIVMDGDIIDIDVINKKVNIELTDEEISKRLKNLSVKLPELKSSYLSFYRKVVSSANTGAVVGGNLP